MGEGRFNMWRGGVNYESNSGLSKLDGLEGIYSCFPDLLGYMGNNFVLKGESSGGDSFRIKYKLFKLLIIIAAGCLCFMTGWTLGLFLSCPTLGVDADLNWLLDTPGPSGSPRVLKLSVPKNGVNGDKLLGIMETIYKFSVNYFDPGRNQPGINGRVSFMTVAHKMNYDPNQCYLIDNSARAGGTPPEVPHAFDNVDEVSNLYSVSSLLEVRRDVGRKIREQNKPPFQIYQDAHPTTNVEFIDLSIASVPQIGTEFAVTTSNDYVTTIYRQIFDPDTLEILRHNCSSDKAIPIYIHITATHSFYFSVTSDLPHARLSPLLVNCTVMEIDWPPSVPQDIQDIADKYNDIARSYAAVNDF